MRFCSTSSPTPTLQEWAKTSVWAADTGGARDDSSSPIRAQRGVWKRLFEQVLEEDAEAMMRIKYLENFFEGNIAGEWIGTIRSLCYDMGHVFEDESELAGCIADMRAIGEGEISEHAFVKWCACHPLHAGEPRSLPRFLAAHQTDLARVDGNRQAPPMYLRRHPPMHPPAHQAEARTAGRQDSITVCNDGGARCP
eukprot:SAG22_NODE_271_length_13227_cov_34.282983_5_plen_196_part_00